MNDIENGAALAHYGVKGMKWGVRRDLKRMKPSERAAYLKEKDAKWRAKVDADPKLGKISSKAARYAKKETKRLKKDYKDRGINLKKDAINRGRYDAELKDVLERSLDRAAYKVHKHPPTRLFEVQIHRHPDGSITPLIAQRHNAKLVKQQGSIAKSDRRNDKRQARADAKAAKALSHADESPDLLVDLEDMPDYSDLLFELVIDDEGYVDDVISAGGVMAQSDIEEMEDLADLGEDALAHFGVKGMKWGVRKSDSGGSGGQKTWSEKSGGEKAATVAKKTAKGVLITAGSVAATAVVAAVGGAVYINHEIIPKVEVMSRELDAAARIMNGEKVSDAEIRDIEAARRAAS